MQTDDGFFREGLQRWGRAQLIVSTFEEKLREELKRIGHDMARDLELAAVDTKPYVYGRGTDAPTIGVEVKGRIGNRAANLVLGVQWDREDITPSYFSAFYEPAELTVLGGCVSPEDKRIGVRIEREEKRDWCVLDVGALGPDEAFGILRKVLQRRLETRP